MYNMCGRGMNYLVEVGFCEVVHVKYMVLLYNHVKTYPKNKNKLQ